MLLPEGREKPVEDTTLDPPKGLIGISKSIVKADTKGKMPVILNDADCRKLNLLIPMLEAPGMGHVLFRRGSFDSGDRRAL